MNTWNLLCFTVTRRALLGPRRLPAPKSMPWDGTRPSSCRVLSPEPCPLSSAGPEAKCMKIL